MCQPLNSEKSWTEFSSSSYSDKWCHVLYNLYHLSIRVWNSALETFHFNISVHCAAQQPDSRWWPYTSQMRLRQNTWMVTIESMPELWSWELYQPRHLFVCYLTLFQYHEPRDVYMNNNHKVIHSKSDIQTYWTVA